MTTEERIAQIIDHLDTLFIEGIKAIVAGEAHPNTVISQANMYTLGVLSTLTEEEKSLLEKKLEQRSRDAMLMTTENLIEMGFTHEDIIKLDFALLLAEAGF